MNNNLIFAAVGYLSDYESTPYMTQEVNQNKGYEIYFKNALVCLISIKQVNADSDVALVTNLQLDENWMHLYEKNDIKIYYASYETFKMPPRVPYSLAYYKICAYDFILKETGYNKFCFVDCDEYAVGNFKNLWKEACDACLLIPNESTIESRVRKEIIEIYNLLYPDNKYRFIVHISSGIICGKREHLEIIMKLCYQVHARLLKFPEITPTGGDEVIWSIALAQYNEKVYSAKPYVLLSNIGARSYFIDKQNFMDSNVILWHLPAEKRYSLRWAYDYYMKRNKLPNVHKMAKASRLRVIHSSYNLLSLIAILGDTGLLRRNLCKIVNKIGVKLNGK